MHGLLLITITNVQRVACGVGGLHKTPKQWLAVN